MAAKAVDVSHIGQGSTNQLKQLNGGSTQHKSAKATQRRLNAAQVSSSSSTKAARQSGTVMAACRIQLKSTKAAQRKQLDEAA